MNPLSRLKYLFPLSTVLARSILLLVALGACSTKIDQTSVIQTETNARNKFDKDLLGGAWWLDPATDPHALFFVEGDSLYYTEQTDDPFVVRIDGDTIIFTQDGLDTKFNLVKLTKDTLAYRDVGFNEVVYLTRGR